MPARMPFANDAARWNSVGSTPTGEPDRSEKSPASTSLAERSALWPVSSKTSGKQPKRFGGESGIPPNRLASVYGFLPLIANSFRFRQLAAISFSAVGVALLGLSVCYGAVTLGMTLDADFRRCESRAQTIPW